MISISCKIVGTVLIILSALKFARNMNNSLENRYKEMVKLHSLLCQLKGRMEYMSETLPESFADLCRIYDEPFSGWMKMLSEELSREQEDSFEEIWIKSINFLADSSCLEKEDLDLLIELKDRLGGMDMENQVKAIDYVMLRIEEKRQLLNEELNDKKKAVMSVSLFVGMVILIILL